MDKIESTGNTKIKNIKALMSKSRLRKETGFFIAEGPRMVFETPKELLHEVYVAESFLSDQRWQDFFADLDRDRVHAYVVSDQLMRQISDTVTPQGVLAVIRQPSYDPGKLMEGDAYILVLERLQDPGNMGTVFRTAEGAGVTGIFMSSDCVDIFSPKVVRSTMGSLFRVPFFVSGDIIKTVSDIRTQGIRLFATRPDAKKLYYEVDYRGACGFMIGNEGAGLSDEISNISDEKITIPMKGNLESLNAAIATGILLYEGSRQRTVGIFK